jgi:hypothetical protein
MRRARTREPKRASKTGNDIEVSFATGSVPLYCTRSKKESQKEWYMIY